MVAVAELFWLNAPSIYKEKPRHKRTGLGVIAIERSSVAFACLGVGQSPAIVFRHQLAAVLRGIAVKGCAGFCDQASFGDEAQDAMHKVLEDHGSAPFPYDLSKEVPRDHREKGNLVTTLP